MDKKDRIPSNSESVKSFLDHTEPKRFSSVDEMLADMKAKEANRSWYEVLFDFIYYDIFCKIKWKVIDPIINFPREVKWFIQRGTRGCAVS